VYVPQGVAELELAVGDGDVGGLLQGGLAVGRAVEGAVDHVSVADSVESPLLVQGQAFIGLPNGESDGIQLCMFHENILFYVVGWIVCYQPFYHNLLGLSIGCGKNLFTFSRFCDMMIEKPP
jgi:hypothetical protein